MRRKSLLHRLTLGLLIAVMMTPAEPAHAQWTVFDPSQYALQVKKRLEEAQRYMKMFDNAVKQLTTLKGVLEQAEDMVAKQRNAITTMANIGRTVRASYQLKDQLEAIVKTRLGMLRSIDDRLRRGIFDPEADLRDLDEYLRTSIGRSSQDTIANLERLARMDNELEKWQTDLQKTNAQLADAQKKRKNALALLDIEKAKADSDICAPCIASLHEQLASYDALIVQLEAQAADIFCRIENRVKQYNIRMQERVRFGEQVQSMNDSWSRFNDSLDELQRALSKVN
jgi:predicted  nucleic acid-binding Zn-ribbon protein